MKFIINIQKKPEHLEMLAEGFKKIRAKSTNDVQVVRENEHSISYEVTCDDKTELENALGREAARFRQIV